MTPYPRILLTLSLLALPSLAWAEHLRLHSDPIAPVILGVTGILFFAVMGRLAARKLGQASVLGELIMGIVLGNLAYFFGVDLILVLREGPAIFDMIEATLEGEALGDAAQHTLGADAALVILEILRGPDGGQILQVAHTVDIFSRYGAIFLLFLVGLEMDLSQMRSVGGASTRVAVVGVLAPFILGFTAAKLLMPDLPTNSDLFIAATLGATSIGITARVLEDIHQSHSQEARIILGAAVIDDILGLIMLAVVSGIIVSGVVHLGDIVATIAVALLFLAAAVFAGPYFLRYAIHHVKRLDVIEAKMIISYLFVMVLAWFANLSGLATIIGAFTAGVILRDSYFDPLPTQGPRRYSIKEMIMPLEVILVPIFFVLMGIQVKLETLLDPEVMGLAAGLLIAAIAGKLAAGWFSGRGSNRLAVGCGMLPRGEVGLIFAAIGKSLGVIGDVLFSAIVLMVVITTLMAPPLLKWSMRHRPPSQPAA